MTASTFSVFVAIFGGEGGGREAGREQNECFPTTCTHASPPPPPRWDAHGAISSTIPPGRAFPTSSCCAGARSSITPREGELDKGDHLSSCFFLGNIQGLGGPWHSEWLTLLPVSHCRAPVPPDLRSSWVHLGACDPSSPGQVGHETTCRFQRRAPTAAY